MPAFEDLPLRGRNLILRPLAPRDADALFAIFSDAKVMRYWASLPWTSVEQAHERIARDTEALAQGGAIRLGLVLKSGGAILGQCTLFDFDEQSRRAEIGYCLSPSAWGRGYMQEALALLLDYGFARLSLNRVEADIDPRNERSAKSLERLGFVREGLLRQRWIVGEEVSDTALYGLLQSEWNPVHVESAASEV